MSGLRQAHVTDLGRRIAASLRYCMFDTKATAAAKLEADVATHGIGGARVEVRHPSVEANGAKWLVGLISLEGTRPRLVYAVPLYRDAIERAVQRIDRMVNEERGWQ